MWNRIPWRDALRIAITVAAVVFGVDLCEQKSQPSCCCPHTPPATPPCDPPAKPEPPKPKQPDPDPLNAIVQIRMSGGYCSACFIDVRRADKKQDMLTAAHCCKFVGERITWRARSGLTGGATVTSIDRQADCAWLVSDPMEQDHPFALLADQQPSPGTPCWHAGFGFDRPANRENGYVGNGPNPIGKVHLKISVSNGDSGGAFIETATGRVFSCVCCSDGVARVSNVYGASLARIKANRLTMADAETWAPLPIPYLRFISQ